MAKDVLFDVDASQILAKLHLAGLQPVGQDAKWFLVNTGIENDNPSAKPDNPGDVRFNLKNDSGNYQIGFVYEITYDIDFGVANQMNSLKALVAKEDSQKIDSKDAKKNEDIQKLKTAIYTALEKDPAAKDLVAEIKDREANPDKHKDKEGPSFATTKGIELAIEKYKEAKNGATIKNSKEDVIKRTFANPVKEKLQKYIETFAGKDNISHPVSEATVAVFDVSNNVKNSNDKNLVKLFEIQPISEQEMGAMTAKFRSTAKEDGIAHGCTSKVCYAMKYVLNVDK